MLWEPRVRRGGGRPGPGPTNGGRRPREEDEVEGEDFWPPSCEIFKFVVNAPALGFAPPTHWPRRWRVPPLTRVPRPPARFENHGGNDPPREFPSVVKKQNAPSGNGTAAGRGEHETRSWICGPSRKSALFSQAPGCPAPQNPWGKQILPAKTNGKPRPLHVGPPRPPEPQKRSGPPPFFFTTGAAWGVVFCVRFCSRSGPAPSQNCIRTQKP